MSNTISKHQHNVIDSDILFRVDPFTRDIIIEDAQKDVLMQGDHNSERFTFEIPRYIEGHDMWACDCLQVYFLNVEGVRNGKHISGVYTVEDLRLNDKEDTVLGSWLISGNATKYVGTLHFMLVFKCLTGVKLDYRWNSNIYKEISVLESLNSDLDFELEHIDVIEQWKEAVMNELNAFVDEQTTKKVDIAKAELSEDLNNKFNVRSEEIDNVLESFDDILRTEITSMDDEIEVLEARMNTFTSLPDGSTSGDAEIADIRADIYGETHPSAGDAVRSQTRSLLEKINYITIVDTPEIEVGSIGNGGEMDMPNRARFANAVFFSDSKLYISAAKGYNYGYAIYDENGVYDGVDHGWNSMSENQVLDLKGKGYVTMNFMKLDATDILDEDLFTIHSSIRIERIDVLDQIKTLRDRLDAGFIVYEDFDVEVGSLSGGWIADMPNRARLTEKVLVKPTTTLYMSKNTDYFYGYAIYDENGVYDGVDHGWTHLVNNTTIVFDTTCYIRMNFMRRDAANMTEDDISTIKGLISFVGKEDSDSIVKGVRDLQNDCRVVKEDIDSLQITNPMDCIDIEYGRQYGASYIFARIPRMTNDGKKISPKVRLTSINGINDGKTRSALVYAESNKTLFVTNAGLFNTSTNTPEGQTIIDGVSITNKPMTDDMGSPISDSECYPLCINSDGILSAPYDRSIDTADMISDGVVQAVTGWGKIIDNFKPCSDTVENEIVHKYTYIRQVIGQYQNGDYFICSVDQTRGSVENEAGITYKDLATLLVNKGVKFAYSLDGGGSTETVIGLRQLNPIYQGEKGRPVPTVIVFEIEDTQKD